MDSSKYVNTYLDFAVGMIHEAVNERLQLKTQMKLANDLVAERDQVISSLKSEMETIRKEASESKKTHDQLDEALKKAKHWEDSYHGLANKASHFDTLTNQFNDLKNQFQAKNTEIVNKNNEIQNKNNEIQNKTNEIAIRTVEIEKLKSELTQLQSVKEEEINKLKSENDAFIKKIEKLELQRKQINTTTRKKSISSAPTLPVVLDFVDSQKQAETNDF